MELHQPGLTGKGIFRGASGLEGAVLRAQRGVCSELNPSTCPVQHVSAPAQHTADELAANLSMLHIPVLPGILVLARAGARPKGPHTLPEG